MLQINKYVFYNVLFVLCVAYLKQGIYCLYILIDILLKTLR